MERWKPLVFKNISKVSSYEVQRENGISFLTAKSNDSASALILKETFSVRDHPKLRWRWKVGKVYPAGNAASKDGDDYPIRLYVLFKFDPDSAGFFDKIKFNTIKALYGEFPPHSSLNYIWANRRHDKRILTSPYTSRSKMIVKGIPGEPGDWMMEEADIIDDYRDAFGTEPPEFAALAVMNDSDDTGDSSTSYIDFIEIFR